LDDVVKIERPGQGDDTRSWGPPFLQDAEGRPTRESGYFLSVNRGKRSVAIDFAEPEGQAVVRALVARSDIVLENFKPAHSPATGSATMICGRSSRTSSIVRSPGSGRRAAPRCGGL
jgi:crotonobetainyl-CoA:carnitine CoA-transferase CaiB-like acyl-CoA transferase